MILSESILFHGRYLLLRKLGKGGSSEVWLADDQRSGMQVALKVYAPGIGLDDDGIQLFKEEFKLVFKLVHPNLLRPTHYDVCDRMPYFVMHYMENGSTMNQAGTFTEEQAWHFLYDVASGLEYLHGRNVIHQDIKLDNILMNDDGDFLIADFGISTKMRTTFDANVKYLGDMTMTYAAPERWSRKNRPVKASDIWSLGASVFELLTGNPPYGELGGRIQFEGADIPEMEGDWSKELTEIIRRCLQRETKNRPTAREIVEACWVAHFDKEKVIPQESRFTTTVRMPVPGNPAGKGYDQRMVSGSDNTNPGPDKITYMIVLAGIMLLVIFGCYISINSKNEKNTDIPDSVQPMAKVNEKFTAEKPAVQKKAEAITVEADKPKQKTENVTFRHEYFIATFYKKTGTFKFKISKQSSNIMTIAEDMVKFIKKYDPDSRISEGGLLRINKYWGSELSNSGQTRDFEVGDILNYQSQKITDNNGSN